MKIFGWKSERYNFISLTITLFFNLSFFKFMASIGRPTYWRSRTKKVFGRSQNNSFFLGLVSKGLFWDWSFLCSVFFQTGLFWSIHFWNKSPSFSVWYRGLSVGFIYFSFWVFSVRFQYFSIFWFQFRAFPLANMWLTPK